MSQLFPTDTKVTHLTFPKQGSPRGAAGDSPVLTPLIYPAALESGPVLPAAPSSSKQAKTTPTGKPGSLKFNSLESTGGLKSGNTPGTQRPSQPQNPHRFIDWNCILIKSLEGRKQFPGTVSQP